jgi:hypothetical protein
MTPAPFDGSLEEMPAEPKPMNEFSRLLGVLMSPSKTFADIAKRPRWWVPLLLSILCTGGFMYSYSKHVGWEQMYRKLFEQNALMRNLDPATKQQIINQSAQVGNVRVIGQTIGGIIVGALLIALVLKFMSNTLLGGEVGYKQMLAVTTYSGIPNIIAALLAWIVMYQTPPDEFDIQNPLAFNLGAYLGDSVPAWIKGGATSIDLFTFWTMGLMAMGMAAAAGRKVSTGKAFGMLLFPWALWVMIRAAIAAL